MPHLIFATLYPPIKSDEKGNECPSLSYIEYYMTKICLKVLSYEKTSSRKEQVIVQLKHELEEEKSQTLSYEIKFKEINEAYTKLIDLKNQLNENVILLQQSLTDKQEKLNSLENLTIEKEKKILSLQENLTNKQEKLNLLENITVEKEKEILSLKEKLSQKANLLQESLTNKEENLKSLKNLNMEKEKEILSLKKIFLKKKGIFYIS